MSRILVADDDEFILELLEAALASAGHEVTTVSGGRAVLQRLRESSFDLVILDVVMPDQGGIETIIELRGSHPNQAIVVMTGRFPSNTDTLKSLTEKLGAKALLAKPFSTDQLLEIVRQHTVA